MLGCCETGVLAGDQLELDELAMFDDAVEPIGSDLQPVGRRCSMMPLNQSVATCSLLAGRVGAQVVGAGEDLGGDTG